MEQQLGSANTESFEKIDNTDMNEEQIIKSSCCKKKIRPPVAHELDLSDRKLHCLKVCYCVL